MTGAVLLAVGCVLLTLALVAYVRRRFRTPPIDDRPSAKPIRGELWLLDHESLIERPREVDHE